MKYKNILVALDLTKDSKIILKQACSIAKIYDSKISVVNIVPPVNHYYTFSNFDEGMYLQEMENNAIHRAKEILNNLLIQCETKFDSIQVIIGHVSEAIRSTYKTLDSDLLIIGTHARSGISKFILGSTAHSLLGGLDLDVLIVNLNDNRKHEETTTNQKQSISERT